jgi:uncharacterized membrane protein
MIESHFRSIVKALSWRFLATVITFCVSWILTRRVTLAAEIGVADALLKLGAYYSHERLWNRLSFGKQKPPEYQI